MALSVWQTSCWPIHCCAVSWLFEGDDWSISWEVADCSLEASLVTSLPSTRKTYWTKQKFLLAFLLWQAPFSVGQDVSRSIRRFSWVAASSGSCTSTRWTYWTILNQLSWWLRRWESVLFINETLSTLWHHHHCYTPLPMVLLIQV